MMEMRLRENPQQFSSALLQLSTRYLFILGAQVCSDLFSLIRFIMVQSNTSFPLKHIV